MSALSNEAVSPQRAHGVRLMGKHHHTTLVIPEEERTQLARMACDMGYVQTRGAGKGRVGSISALVRALARGAFSLTPNNNDQTQSPPASNPGTQE